VSSVLFCPFCREAFEGEPVCPDHDLALVDFRVLAPSKPPRADDADVPWWSPALGRGLLAAGAIGTLAAFMVLPFASSEGATRMGGSMLKLALFGSPKLWPIAAASVAQLALLGRRRSALSLRRARAAALIIAVVPSLATAWAFSAAQDATAQLAAREGVARVLSLASGGYVIALCALLMVASAARLGR
jgi:hypothetical protein